MNTLALIAVIVAIVIMTLELMGCAADPNNQSLFAPSRLQLDSYVIHEKPIANVQISSIRGHNFTVKSIK